MKTMIQIAILAVILTPAATYADPRVARPVKRPTGLIMPAPKPHPTPKPHPRPAPKPTPAPHPGHRHHHHHHHHAVAVAAAAASAAYVPAADVAQTVAPATPAPAMLPSGERALTTREFLNGRDRFVGQRVVVFGRVTQAVRGMGGQDYYILDGVVRCEFPRYIQSANGVRVGAGRFVTITGTAAGGWHATASADLVECAHAF